MFWVIQIFVPFGFFYQVRYGFRIQCSDIRTCSISRYYGSTRKVKTSAFFIHGLYFLCFSSNSKFTNTSHLF